MANIESTDNHKERRVVNRRIGRLYGLAAHIFLFSNTAIAIYIVVEWTIDVKAYLQICESGLPEAYRPSACTHCLAKCKPHRHGKFMRSLFTLEEALEISVFRFRCPECRKTFSVLPLFVESHHQSAVDVKEAVVRSGEEGRSLTAIAADSASFAGGRYAEKTIWRWQQCWRHRRDRHEEQIWYTILHHGLDVPLPRERRSTWKALRAIWLTLSRPDRLFHELLRLDRLSGMAAAR